MVTCQRMNGLHTVVELRSVLNLLLLGIKQTLQFKRRQSNCVHHDTPIIYYYLLDVTLTRLNAAFEFEVLDSFYHLISFFLQLTDKLLIIAVEAKER